ncbi:hypothetical protein J2Y00_000236 [Deinococcus soli (ex Cha et al. 2016)]|uniref:Uncharacterized protein n=2 Tax=Deinococcus soli (ex Cha et al. 2016) TaxID=1309411 RepID=A0ACC6KBF1_9DEIO|nr:hypothetical protein [Deinococcus soli (ex Cha et al. 2016)]MDR6327508.1 hypothetical protein [Deinococcus soli (ex Cha et al. 2016)]MDR6749783.1 hypothetical protein [Deinococcus soli (ex Cha et al. 2016)]
MNADSGAQQKGAADRTPLDSAPSHRQAQVSDPLVHTELR